MLISRLYCYGGADRSVSFSGSKTSNCIVTDSLLNGHFTAQVDFKIINTTVTSDSNLVGSVTGTFVGCHLAQIQLSGGGKLYFDNCILGDLAARDVPPLHLIKGYSAQNENSYEIYANNSKFIRNKPSAEKWFHVSSPAIPSENSRFSFTDCDFLFTDPQTWNAGVAVPWGHAEFEQCRFALNSPLNAAAFRPHTTNTESAHLDITISNCTFSNYSFILADVTNDASVIIRNCKVTTPMTRLITSGGSVERTLNVQAQTNCYKSWPSEYVVTPSGSSNFTVNLTVSGDYYMGMRNSGNSSSRPVGLSSNHAGYQYFDTDLGKMICWNGSAWINMDGTQIT